LPQGNSLSEELIKMAKFMTSPLEIAPVCKSNDKFVISSGNLIFHPIYIKKDILFEGREVTMGTSVFMEIRKDSKVKIEDVFNEYTQGKEDYGFSKTIVPVKLLQSEGDSLISRSQAKRLIARFEKFKEVVLDFDGINMIGQLFADELFRVFQNRHPNVHLVWINGNQDVEKMIKHAKANL